MTRGGRGAAPRVVLLAADLHDRARAAALDLAAAGADVTVVLPSTGAVRERFRLGAASVVRVPVVPLFATTPPALPLVGARDPRQEQVASLRAAVLARTGRPEGELRRQARRARARLGRRTAVAVDRWWARLPAVRRHAGAFDLELALGPLVDTTGAAALHALDPSLVPVAAWAAGRLGVPWLYDGPAPRDRFARGLLRTAARVLDGGPLRPAYAELLGWRPVAATAAPAHEVPDTVARPTVLAVGPANSAGQGWAWAQAVARRHPGVGHHVLARRNERYDYPADELVAPRDYLDPAWSLRTAERAAGWSHALLEAGRPLLGTGFGRDFRGDVEVLQRLGVRPGLVFHGSEVRDPRRHAATHPFSPFTDPSDAATRRLQARCDALLPLLDGLDLPMFVSTADQLAYVPGAQWLPVVLDTDVWQPQEGTLERPVPLVVHAPSTPWLKGTDVVRSVLEPLAEKGLVDFRLVTGLPPAEAAALVRSADVVVDQLLLGLYGVLACEAMASGRLVLGNVGEDLRSRVGLAVPVVETTPATLGSVLERVLDDRDWARAQAARGPGFVAEVHDGRRSAAVLEGFLGVTGGPV